MQISPYFVRFRMRFFHELQAINRRYLKDGQFFTLTAYLRPFRDPYRNNPPNFPEADFWLANFRMVSNQDNNARSLLRTVGCELAGPVIRFVRTCFRSA